MTEQQAQLLEEAFNRWWYNEGSGMPPKPGEEHVQHIERMTRIAWHRAALETLVDLVHL